MIRRFRRFSVLALALALAATLITACQADEPTSKRVKVIGTDGTTGKSFGAHFDKDPGAIAGMRGTTPLAKLSDDFTNRLKQRNPNIVEFSYAAESYDATVITALAAQVVGTNEGTAIASQINATTAGGTKCRRVQECLDQIEAGANIDYDGIGGGLDFTSAGEPAVGNYGLVSYGHNGQVTNTTYVVTGDPKNAVTDDAAAPSARTAARTGGSLRIGTLLPQSGALSSYGPGMLAGVELAVSDINDAGGVNGARITLIPGDDGTDPTVAAQTADRLLRQNVDVIVGPAASAVGKAIIESVTSAGVVLFSPGNTLDEFTTINDRGLYFRTAPPDALQARLIANIMVQEGKHGDVIAVMHQNTAYGTSLANEIKRNLLAADVKPADIVLVGYDPANHDYRPQVRKLKSARPDFIVLAGYEEAVAVVRALNTAGLGPRR